MPLISQPPTNAVDRLEIDDKRTPSLTGVMPGWRNFFVAVFNICNALTLSGTTAQRPTAQLWDGRMFWDKTLAIPIWYDGAAAVWVNAAGAPV